MDGDEMHVLGQALYRGCYLQSHRNMLPIMKGGICDVTCEALCAMMYSYGLY